MRTTARITALSPGQSPPPVSTPIRIAQPYSSMKRWLAGRCGGGWRAQSVPRSCTARRLARDPKRRELENPPRGHEVTLPSADGTRLHAEVFGPESGQTVVLVHGWTETIAMWIYVIPQLVSRGFRVVGTRAPRSRGERSGGQ